MSSSGCSRPVYPGADFSSFLVSSSSFPGWRESWREKSLSFMTQTYWRRSTNTTHRKSYIKYWNQRHNDHTNYDVPSNNELLRYVRTGQLGHGTPRRPEIIDDFGVYKWECLETLWSLWHFETLWSWHFVLRRVVKSKIGSLIREGPDRRPSAYTPLGPLRRQQSGLIGRTCHQSCIWPVNIFHITPVISSHAYPLIPASIWQIFLNWFSF